MKNNNSPFLSDYELVDEFETATDLNNEMDNPFFGNEIDYEYSESESPFLFEDRPTQNWNNGSLWNNKPQEHDFELEDHEMLQQLMTDLNDQEFNHAIYEVASHVRTQIYTPFLLNEFENETQENPRNIAENYLSPLRFEAEGYFNNLASNVGNRDVRSYTDYEIENLFDGYLFEGEVFDEKQEFFFKKLKEKAKKVIQKVNKVAKKLKKFLPMGKILSVLGKLVRPLIEKVIKLAINKLPQKIRPIAFDLANKIFKKTKQKFTEQSDENSDEQTDEDRYENSPFADEPVAVTNNIQVFNQKDESEETTEPETAEQADPEAIPSSGDVQEEFNANFLQMLTANEYEHHQIVENYFSESKTDDSFQNHEFFSDEMTDYEYETDIESARQNFIYELNNLQEGESAEPAIQNFLPMAIKPALKLALKFIGKEKVENLLAKLIAKWISKFIGQQKAMILSSHLVKAGFKLLNFEVENGQNNPQIANEAIADVVEEVVRKVSNLPEETLMNEELLTQEAYLAFEQAAAAIFPDNLIKYENREAKNTNGTWQSIPMPDGSRKYRKYSQTFEVSLDKNKIKYIKTFGGGRLETFLTEKMSVSLDGQTAQVHLYEAMPNCMLSEIAVNETAIASLGTGGEESYAQIHPLTPVAAAVLLNEVGLASDDDDKYLQSRDKIKEGQRFFVLEIAGAGRVNTANYNNSSNSVVNSSNNVLQGDIIFPLRVKPDNDKNGKWKSYYWGAAQGTNQATFLANRSSGRKHGARDLYTPPNTEVIAVADGKVLYTSPFYAGTNEIAIHHETISGREFIARYGEVDPNSMKVKAGDRVKQGQVIAQTGKLIGIKAIPGHQIYMLHFEYFTGAEGFNVGAKPLTNRGKMPLQRRADLKDSLEILMVGYSNTFENVRSNVPKPVPSINNSVSMLPINSGNSIVSITGIGNSKYSSQTAFIKKYAANFIRACSGSFLFPSVMMAQACVETGYGTKGELHVRVNNLFGIKANSSWGGKVISTTTTEEIGGKRQKFVGTGKVYSSRKEAISSGANIQTLFRVYDSIENGIQDRNLFLNQNDRYAKSGVFKAKTPFEQISAIKKAGYATDSDYVKTVMWIINTFHLDKMDK